MKLRTIVVTAAVAAVMVACSPSGSETPNPTPETPPPMTTDVITPTRSPTPTPSSTPSPSPTVIQSFPPPPAGETEEQAAIREGWMNYWIVFDRYLKDESATDLSAAKIVTVPGSEESSHMLDIIGAYRDKEVKAVGDRQFRDVKISPRTEQDGVFSAVVSYCHDSTELTLVDSISGEPSEIPPIATMTERVNLERGNDGLWRVASLKNETAPC